MDSPSKQMRKLHPLNTQWSNKSHSSITTTSDTATYHSAHANISSHMELHSLSHRAPSPFLPKAQASPILKAMKMSRQDSGYSDTSTQGQSQSPTLPSSRRTSLSTSSTRRLSPSKTTKRRTSNHNSSGSTSRPATKRQYKSSPQTTQLLRSSTSSTRRPSIPSRHTTPVQHSYLTNSSAQFFHFPSLAPEPASPPQTISAPPQPPATVHYWTSDSTRRLEYAAIDAASQGVRGFFIKLVPDCILPKEKRRTRFCEGDEGSEAGSVRRYRLDLPEEKEQVCKRVGTVRRWLGLGKKNL